MIESGAAKTIIRAGKHPQNMAAVDASVAGEIRKVYRHEPGYPDLTTFKQEVKLEDQVISYYPGIAAASGPIKNVDLGEEGVTLFREFGAEGSTHGVKVDKSNPAGMWWGIGDPPQDRRRVAAEIWGARRVQPQRHGDGEPLIQ